MPVSAQHPCAGPACPVLLPRGVARCEAHQRKVAAQDNERRGTAHERGYTSRWAKARATYLLSHPLCVQCDGYDRIVPATLVDHITPHRGDTETFWDEGNWQSLCARCHNTKTATEDGGFGSAAALPPGLRPSLVPFVVVAGPPGGGKSTWMERRAAREDLTLDLDVIRARLCGRPIYDAPDENRTAAMRERNARLMELANPQARWPRAWLIASAPTAAARRWWRTRAGARVLLLLTPLETCLARIAGDHRRRDRQHHIDAARAWWRAYQPDASDEVAE